LKSRLSIRLPHMRKHLLALLAAIALGALGGNTLEEVVVVGEVFLLSGNEESPGGS
jgi:hypothetical protein